MQIKYRPSNDDKEEATNVLKEILDFDKNQYAAAKILRDFLNSFIPGCIETYTALKNSEDDLEVELDDEKIPRLVVDLLDIELLEQKPLREILLDKLFQKDKFRLRSLEKKESDPSEWNDSKAKDLLDKLKRERWYTGGTRARKFAQLFGFPPLFAGFPAPHRPEYSEAVETRHRLEPLRDFQENIKNQMLQLLRNRNGLENRGIVRLPTGAGKTRAAAEAVLDFWKEKDDDIQFIIWIAQYNELCEQAVACFRQLWEENGEREKILKLFRVYSGGPLPRSDDEGIIIAGIDQLDEFVSAGNVQEMHDELQVLKEQIGAVIVDEAHRSITSTYKKVFKSLGIETSPKDSEQIPLVGLTATPYRSSDIQTANLLKMYNDKVLYPNQEFAPPNGFDEKWNHWDFVLEKLTEEKILAKPHYHTLETSASFDMDSNDTYFLETKNKLSPHFLSEVGINKTRNKEVYNEILRWANNGRNILFFGASLNQAILMSKLLNEEGIDSAVVTGSTNYGARLNYIRLFREKKIRILCNYEVLTTGFDAPKVDTVIIARPTESRTLYEQMVGRGLRGTEFGGTEECDIITVKDNIYKYTRERVRLGSEEFLSDVKHDEGIGEFKKMATSKTPQQYAGTYVQTRVEIPSTGEIFTEAELSKRFGVQVQGGIRYTTKNNIVILIDSAAGDYVDIVDEKTGTIIYTGMGLYGDQTWTAFNERIRDSDDKILLYFQKPAPNKIIYKYKVKYLGHYYANEKDKNGSMRKVIKFRLQIIS